MFHGSIVALVTPMNDHGEIDFKALETLVDWHLEEGSHGFVILGTTGESPTITLKERKAMLSQVVRQVSGRVPVIAGTGTNSTQSSIALTKLAMEEGVDACLLVTPYYNRPSQEGLYQHYKAVANAVPIPQILYNVPSRTGCDLLPTTIKRLSLIPNIVGVKDASGDLSRIPDMTPESHDRFDLFTGEDPSAKDFILKGGKGVISVVANVAPKLVYEMAIAATKGDEATANALDAQLQPLSETLFLESNPIPTKWALTQMGKMAGGIRLPLTPLAEKHHQAVLAALQAVGIKINNKETS